MKTCEICHRPIKTGRKYCWEHRRTAQAEALRGNKVINEATEGYYNYHTKRNDKKLFAITIVLEVIWLIIIFMFFGINSKLFPYLFFMGSIGVIFVSFCVAGKYFGVEFQYYKKIKGDIENRDPKYIK